MPFEPASKFLPQKYTHIKGQKTHIQLEFDSDTSGPAKVICGLDEVGRGPWAGPLVAAAVILTKNIQIPANKDSKKLTEKKREEIFIKLQKNALCGIGIAEVEEIETLGLTKATSLAFCRAIENLCESAVSTSSRQQKIIPDYLLIDGRAKWQVPYPYTTIIKGDERVKVIACASIIAKVTRDRLMKEYAKKYPHYGFEDHKGYGTFRHQQALAKHGPCEIHRKSFAPIAEYLNKKIIVSNSGCFE